jgi:hypothetical protein
MAEGVVNGLDLQLHEEKSADCRDRGDPGLEARQLIT